jgi:hypothetical protein
MDNFVRSCPLRLYELTPKEELLDAEKHFLNLYFKSTSIFLAFDASSKKSSRTPLHNHDKCTVIYNGLPPIKSDHLRTSPGIPSFRGSFSLMQRAKSSAVWHVSQQLAGRLMEELKHTLGSMKSGTPKSTAFLRIT